MDRCALVAVILLTLGCGSDGIDGQADADADTDECTPLIEDEACNPLDNCGCPRYNNWCGPYVIAFGDGTVCSYAGVCLDLDLTNFLDIGDECPFPPFYLGARDYCPVGSVCLPEGTPGTARCVKLCRTSEDCGSGSCVPGPTSIPVPDDYSPCPSGSTVDLEYSICS